jgi:sortase (surface protein transpeptidase)
MKNYAAITTKAIGYIGVILMLVPIGLLFFELLFPNGIAQADDFNVEKENAVLLEPIFEKATQGFKDPFLEIKNEQLSEPPMEFNVPVDTVTHVNGAIRIPTLGVDTRLYESQNAELGLEYGIWRDPNHGTPDRYDKPIVLGGHRWGKEEFTWDFRTKNLFFKFDQLRGGEIVEIDWNNKTYLFKIRKVEQNFVVNDMADLIMYTCVYYGSPERYIVYADRI